VSDADSFIQEVSEEVRRDRLFGLWKRYGPFVIGGVVAVVAATGVDAWLKHQQAADAREAGAALLRAAEASDPARRAEALLAAADAAGEGAAMLARLQAAAALAEAGDAAAAARVYRGVAEDATTPPEFAAFAAYRAAVLAAPETGPAAAVAALTPLAAEGQPFRALALEALAGLKLQNGDEPGARADLEALVADQTLTQATRDRAGRLLAALSPAEAS
jgi:hypothetical protein